MNKPLIDQVTLASACEGLGLDIETLPRFLRESGSNNAELIKSRELPLSLSDVEWTLIEPMLPPGPPQLDTLDNRAFVDAVIWIATKGKAWTHLGQISHEAVRRKFGRWAGSGIWQSLYEAVAQSELLPERIAQFQRIAERAESLRKKAIARRHRSKGG